MKNKYKKIALCSFSIFFTVLPMFFKVLAIAPTTTSSGTTEIPNPISATTIGEIITKASSLIAPFAILGFTGCVIYAGYVRMFAAGNPEKEAKSMKIAIAAAVGFAIIALAPVIINVITNLIGVKDVYTGGGGTGTSSVPIPGN